MYSHLTGALPDVLCLQSFSCTMHSCSGAVSDKNAPVVETQAMFLIVSVSFSFLFCTVSVFRHAFSCLGLIESPEGGMHSAVRFKGMLAYFEHWNVRTVSYSAIPNIWRDPSFPWWGYGSETSDYGGLFHCIHRTSSSVTLEILTTVLNFVRRLWR